MTEFLLDYYGVKPAEEPKTTENRTTVWNYEDALYGSDVQEAELGEPVIPEEDPFKNYEESEEYVDKHIIEEYQTISSALDAYEAALVNPNEDFDEVLFGDEPKDEPTPKPEEVEFTESELEAFRKLNGIEAETFAGEHEVNEKPTETKVKSVKVSKPKAPAKKPAKTPKAPAKKPKK